MKGELIVHEDPKSPISEIFRTLRTNIQFTYTKNSLKTILVASTLQGEGKSWISSNLAVTFAQAGKRVCLVDADMRRGRQYAIFGASPRPGLSNYLSGVDANMKQDASDDLRNYIQETDVENLYLMAAGNIPPNPSELLSSEQMEQLLEQLKKMFDIVVIDGTPNQLVTDSLILTRMVDSTLLVASCNQTKKEDLKRIVKNIKNVGGKIAGVVVNKLPMSTKKYNQSYYYGSTAMAKSKPSHRTETRKVEIIDEEPIRKDEKEQKTVVDNNISSEPINRIRIAEEQSNSNKIEFQNAGYDSNNDKNNGVNTNYEAAETSHNDVYKKVKINEPTLNRGINVEAPGISLEKTEEILKQVNEYLENEKKKLY